MPDTSPPPPLSVSLPLTPPETMLVLPGLGGRDALGSRVVKGGSLLSSGIMERAVLSLVSAPSGAGDLCVSSLSDDSWMIRKEW